MVKNQLQLFSALLLLISLNGCYCFYKIYGEASPRYLESPPPFSLCSQWSGEGKSMQTNIYYGFPSTMKKEYTNFYTGDSTISHDFHSPGQLGLRLEKYIAPGKIPFCIVGLGLDFSISSLKLNYTERWNYFNCENEINSVHSRMMGSINVMTLVQDRCIGYVSLQGGYNFVNNSYHSSIAAYPFRDIYRPGRFEYRIAYGLQFYSSSLLGLNVECGYGGGAYIRTGICYWIK